MYRMYLITFFAVSYTHLEMFQLVHEMRTRIITSPSFTSDHILAAILFENTMERKIGDCLLYTSPFLRKDWRLRDILGIERDTIQSKYRQRGRICGQPEIISVH